MIDFHTHILPGLDDGSRSIEETFEIIDEAKKVGFNGIIFTSHYMEGNYEKNEKERLAWTEALSQKIDGIDFYLGSEIYATSEIATLLKEHKASTINKSKYVLFEMPLNGEIRNIYDIIYAIQENRMVPILAHPERYGFVQENPEILNELIESGVLIQSNYGSFIGQYSEKAEILVRKMAQNNLIHFLGSDVHRANSVYKNMLAILKEIEEIVGKEKLEELTEINPRLVLENKPIDIGDYGKVKYSLVEKIRMNK